MSEPEETPGTGGKNPEAPEALEAESEGDVEVLVDEPDVDEDEDSDEPRVPREIALQGIAPEKIARVIDTFDDLPMHERLKESVAKIGWEKPTAVQKLCLPYSLRGRDVAGFAQTGTGKTGVFLLTIANKLLEQTPAGVDLKSPRAVVLAPTRELAMQINQDAESILAHVGLKSLAVFGGIGYDEQAAKIREGVDVIIATPGRLIDYAKKNVVNLKNVSVFVCDEADRMFDMGFIEDVEFFLKRIPETAQKLLFSATTNEEVKELAFEYLETPEYISVTPETITPEKIEMHAIHCHATNKLRVMLGLWQDHKPACALVFTNTKLTAEWLHFKLAGNGIEVDLITGDLPQKKRIKLIETIKEGTLKALIATDVASRGLHIAGVTHVYNFDLPDDASNFVHRVGRTARAGARGLAYNLVCDDYGHNLAAINDLLGEKVAMKSEWFDEKYLDIVDKAGNPFADRYKKKFDEEYREGPRGGDRGGSDRGRFDGPRGASASDRPRHDGPRPDGPRPDGPRPDGPRPDGPRGDRPDRDRGPRSGARNDRPDRDRQDRDQPQRMNGPRPQGGAPQQQAQGGDLGPDGKKKRRRRRGRGKGEGAEGAPQGGQRAQGQQGGPRSNAGRSGHGQQIARSESTGFFGMVKRLFRLLFGGGKK